MSALERDDMSWRDEALCAQTDPEAFFPEKGGTVRLAKQVCMACPVREACLAYSLEHDERYGIWGGLSEQQRRVLRKGKPRQRERKTHCVNGHPYTPENTGVKASGATWCRTCDRLARHAGGAA